MASWCTASGNSVRKRPRPQSATHSLSKILHATNNTAGKGTNTHHASVHLKHYVNGSELLEGWWWYGLRGSTPRCARLAHSMLLKFGQIGGALFQYTPPLFSKMVIMIEVHWAPCKRNCHLFGQRHNAGMRTVRCPVRASRGTNVPLRARARPPSP